MSFWLLTVSEVQPLGLLRKRPLSGDSGSLNTALYCLRSATERRFGARSLITYAGTYQPSSAFFTVSPMLNTWPACSALIQAGLRPAHSSPMTWMSLRARATSMLTVLPGRVSVG
ncbi:hypothetical protein D3C79_901190 [compost metagenome]